MLRHQFPAAIVIWLVGSLVCMAQTPRQNEPDAAAEKLQLMLERVKALKIEGHENEKIQVSDHALLRYNDATRGVVDASLWAIGKTGRPRAVLAMEVYNFVQYEFTAIADPPKSIAAGKLTWAPAKTQISWLPIKAKPPHESKRIQNRQLKQLARDFSASEEWRGQNYQLRLMPQPIHEYEDQALGVLNGAVFALAHGTNVEILMSIEAREDKEGKRSWYALFSRLASASLDVRFRKEPFWKSGNYTQVGPQGAYFFKSLPLESKSSSLVP